MWGSWAGALVIFCWSLIGIIEKTAREGFFSCMNNMGPQGSDNIPCSFFEFLLSPLMIFNYIFIVAGFLVGWGIHTIVRQSRSKSRA